MAVFLKNIKILLVTLVFLLVTLTVGWGKSDVSATVPIVNVLASTSYDGSGWNGESRYSSVSKDGKYIAFWSQASNLVTNDTNGVADIFVRDVANNSTTRVSVASDGTQANRPSANPKISSDGRYVVFESTAFNLISSDVNNDTSDIFIHDRQTGVTELVSKNTSGAQANSNGHSYEPDISRDGRYVVFSSAANNFDPNAYFINGSKIYVRDRKLNTTTLISKADDGTIQTSGHSSQGPTISCDGAHVAFTTSASNLTANDTNGYSDVLLVDRVGGHKVYNVTEGGNAPTSNRPSVSCDGSTIIFASTASNLISDDTNGVSDIFTYNVTTGTKERVSVNSSGSQASGMSDNPSISSNGKCVAFASHATELAGGNNNIKEVFIRNLLTGTTELVSRRTTQVSVYESDRPEISDNGKYISYDSADALQASDSDGTWDIYRSETGAQGCDL